VQPLGIQGENLIVHLREPRLMPLQQLGLKSAIAVDVGLLRLDHGIDVQFKHFGLLYSSVRNN
jgi:hypothetical protein